MSMRTPVALIIFNRAHTTERVFAEIAKAKPRKLLVVADGPRSDRPGEAEKCAAARAVVDRVDWNCQVLKNYSDINLGCGVRPATGISWVFDQVEEAIILEDDCLPHPAFFRFCDELLEKYRDDERIMQIAGNNFQFGNQRTFFSYFFSHHNICWGWASWRRAWQYFDLRLRLWPSLRDTRFLLDILGDSRAAEFWGWHFDRAHSTSGNVDFWDYQWTFACWAHNGLSILPNATLVSNIGFGPDATHTRGRNSPIAYLQTEDITFPLQHPPYMVRHAEADDFVVQKLVLSKMSKQPSLLQRFFSKCSAVIPGPVRKPIAHIRSKLI